MSELENAEPVSNYPVLRKKRKAKRRYVRRPPVEEGAQPKRPKPSSLANAEIDSRIAQAIRDRAEAMTRVSELIHWQDRLARLEQEINSLIGYQQRLSGVDRIDIHGATSDGRYTPILSSSPIQTAPFAGHMAPIPEGVGSIPTKTPNPRPSGGNAVDIAKEGGFA
jgi:hypothetical protein